MSTTDQSTTCPCGAPRCHGGRPHVARLYNLQHPLPPRLRLAVKGGTAVSLAPQTADVLREEGYAIYEQQRAQAGSMTRAGYLTSSYYTTLTRLRVDAIVARRQQRLVRRRTRAIKAANAWRSLAERWTGLRFARVTTYDEARHDMIVASIVQAPDGGECQHLRGGGHSYTRVAGVWRTRGWTDAERARGLRLAIERAGAALDVLYDYGAHALVLIERETHQRYHVALDGAQNPDACAATVRAARAAFLERRRLSRNRALDAWVTAHAAALWVSVDDSVAAGNCPAGTRQYAERLTASLMADGELGAVRADVLLAHRDDSYTRRACAAAALRRGALREEAR